MSKLQEVRDSLARLTAGEIHNLSVHLTQEMYESGDVFKLPDGREFQLDIPKNLAEALSKFAAGSCSQAPSCRTGR